MSDRTRVIKDILWFFALAGLMGAIFRLWYGLGATTNLSDAVPWGLWKVLNMVGGVALSTSGFTVGFLVYVLKIKKFEPFMKPAILIAFLGYGCSCLALLFDIGLPHLFWHPIFMWNINSFLFEVFWCVMLYFTVTTIELAPVFLEKFRAEKVARWLHRIAPVIVIIGISLSSLHHSSLGSLFLVTPARLHPLWYTPWLPVLFIVSAMGAGLMVVVLAKVLWARWYEPTSVLGPQAGQQIPLITLIDGRTSADFARGPEGPEMPRIRSLAIVASGVLGFYLLLKGADLAVNGGWSYLMAGTWESWLFLIEITLTAILPVLLIAIPRSRHSVAGISVAAFSSALGLALNRLDVGIFGYLRDAATFYFPSMIEWSVGLGVIAAATLVFLFVTEHFPIFSPNPPAQRSTAGLFRLPFGGLAQLWKTALMNGLHRVTLLAVFIIPIVFVFMYPPFHMKTTTEMDVRPATGVDAERAVLRIDGNHHGVETVFAHAEHQKRLGDSASCGICHHVSLPNDKSTPCSRCHRKMNEASNIFQHGSHMQAVAEREKLGGIQPANHSCVTCHAEGQPKSAASANDCMTCHREDMFTASTIGLADTVHLATAHPFREAMHRTCITCHLDEAAKLNKPHLGDCQTCHESLRARPAVSSPIAGM